MILLAAPRGFLRNKRLIEDSIHLVYIIDKFVNNVMTKYRVQLKSFLN